jgi:hypothetical protein
MGFLTPKKNITMHDRVVNIETYPIGSHSISFAGTLRNEKKFELHQKVFIESHGMMHQCRIVGIELPPAENPEFRYLIEIPKELIELKENESYIDIDKSSKDRISRTCENIFSTIDSAKESALLDLERKYKLNKDNIERFFKRYEQ